MRYQNLWPIKFKPHEFPAPFHSFYFGALENPQGIQ
jgi:hypothetical protein